MRIPKTGIKYENIIIKQMGFRGKAKLAYRGKSWSKFKPDSYS